MAKPPVNRTTLIKQDSNSLIENVKLLRAALEDSERKNDLKCDTLNQGALEEVNGDVITGSPLQE